MPVKTDSCVFSEEKIYPGHGVSFVRRDGKKVIFVTCKTRHLYLGGRKALNERWTKSWRRAHKKESILRSVKKDKGRKTLKSERGIEGLSLQDLLRKKNETAEDRKKAVLAKKAAQKPATKAAKKADLNSRLRELRKKRKEKEEQKQQAQSGGAKKAGGGKKKGQQGGGKKKGGGGGKKSGGKKGKK